MARGARLIAGVAAAALLVAVAVARTGDVVARDVVLPSFERYTVTQVRVLGAELYVDASTDAGDVATAAVLVLVAALLGSAALRLRADPRAGAFATAAAGATFLALDDLLAAHETLGHNLPVLARLPLVDHPDDAIVAAYGLVAAAFLWRHRALLRGASPVPWVVAAAAGGLAVAHDVLPLHFRRTEEALELLAVLAALAGIVLVVRRNVT